MESIIKPTLLQSYSGPAANATDVLAFLLLPHSQLEQDSKFIPNHRALRVANAFSNPFLQVMTVPLNCSPDTRHINSSHYLVLPANLMTEISPSYHLSY